jgi:hypothetical protein
MRWFPLYGVHGGRIERRPGHAKKKSGGAHSCDGFHSTACMEDVLNEARACKEEPLNALRHLPPIKHTYIINSDGKVPQNDSGPSRHDVLGTWWSASIDASTVYMQSEIGALWRYPSCMAGVPPQVTGAATNIYLPPACVGKRDTCRSPAYRVVPQSVQRWSHVKMESYPSKEGRSQRGRPCRVAP